MKHALDQIRPLVKFSLCNYEQDVQLFSWKVLTSVGLLVSKQCHDIPIFHILEWSAELLTQLLLKV
jgi:hypothetical protein